MLVIRMQRTGRKGHAQFRVVVQDSRRTPTSGNIVALLGSYNPHTKTATIDKEKISSYLEHGAQPSERVARLLTAEGVKLPNWVKQSDKKTGKLRNPDKLRRNRPAEAVVETAEPKGEQPESAETPAEATPSEPEPATELVETEPSVESQPDAPETTQTAETIESPEPNPAAVDDAPVAETAAVEKPADSEEPA